MSKTAPKKYQDPADAVGDLAEQLSVVGIDTIRASGVGRVLAQEVSADRDSPAADVSAMDGYAIRLSDLGGTEPVPISGESAPGAPPPAMRDEAVVRIFTGAIVPPGCDAVVKREETEELEGAIRFRESAMSTQVGEHIRRAGENAKAGSTVLSPGRQVTAAHRATMANFGCFDVDVYLPVRVSVITTGDEVGLFADDQPAPWQLRNSNSVSLTSLLESFPWVKIEHVDHCKDDREALTRLLSERIQQSDAILMTGGVSMGDYDYVPDVVQDIGGSVVFHGLPIRPGKPILGAASGDGKLLLGLPGNPVSATIGCRRMAMPLLAKISGQTQWMGPCPVVRLENAGDKTIPLHWMRLVQLTDHGTAQAVISQGSGDLVSLGNSTGFVEVPPGTSGEGPWPYYAW
jgi:molybdopterin molybdotransferase